MIQTKLWTWTLGRNQTFQYLNDTSHDPDSRSNRHISFVLDFTELKRKSMNLWLPVPFCFERHLSPVHTSQILISVGCMEMSPKKWIYHGSHPVLFACNGLLPCSPLQSICSFLLFTLQLLLFTCIWIKQPQPAKLSLKWHKIWQLPNLSTIVEASTAAQKHSEQVTYTHAL